MAAADIGNRVRNYLVGIGVVALVIWLIAIIGLQCLGWASHAVWQPVPASALFLSEHAQVARLAKFSDSLNALSLVPSIGSLSYPEEAGPAIAPKALGVQIVINWLLDLPLTLWLVGLIVLVASRYREPEPRRARSGS